MKLTHLKRPSNNPLEEAGPFLYGAKKPRAGSVRDIADKKRKEQERKTLPIEPRDQMVGKAKVERNLNEGPFGDALKSMVKTYKDVSADPLDKTGKREAAGYVKQFKDEFIRWSNQTQNSNDPNNIELILKFLETQKGFTPEQIAAIKKAIGMAVDEPETEEPEAPTEVAVDTKIFKDATAFKAEWDKLLASNPTYKLISDPDLLSVLKNIWMKTGGTKLESVRNKGAAL